MAGKINNNNNKMHNIKWDILRKKNDHLAEGIRCASYAEGRSWQLCYTLNNTS